MTKPTLITLPETAVIGMEGLCTPENNIVSELWAKANARFGEVAPLAAKTEGGAFKGFWGAMSDETRSFAPWTEGFSRGLYLAGAEVPLSAQAPEGWTKWTLPARTYLSADVTPDTYAGVFADTITRVLPEYSLTLSGAVCDFTDPASGRAKLLFPVTEG